MARRDKTFWRVVVAQGAAGQTAVKAAETGQIHCVVGFLGSVDANGTFAFQTASTDITGDMPVAANAPFGFSGSPDFPLLVTVAGEALNVVTATGKFFGVVYGYTEGT